MQITYGIIYVIVYSVFRHENFLLHFFVTLWNNLWNNLASNRDFRKDFRQIYWKCCDQWGQKNCVFKNSGRLDWIMVPVPSIHTNTSRLFPHWYFLRWCFCFCILVGYGQRLFRTQMEPFGKIVNSSRGPFLFRTESNI